MSAGAERVGYVREVALTCEDDEDRYRDANRVIYVPHDGTDDGTPA